jgi:hypothetical protein
VIYLNNKKRVLTKQALFSPSDDGQFGLESNLPDSQIQSPAKSNFLLSIINKFGGIDSILSTFEKAQKLIQTISPYLPQLVSLLKRKKRIPTKLNRLKRGKRHTIKKTVRPISNSHKKKLPRKVSL